MEEQQEEQTEPVRCRSRRELLRSLVVHAPPICEIAGLVNYVRHTSRKWHKEDQHKKDDEEEEVLRAGRIAGQVWFRGHGDCELGLRPGLYREKYFGPLLKPGAKPDSAEVFEALIDLEHELRIDFTSYGHLLNPSDHAKTQIDWYFLMQHHRIPTRLLDWTTNTLAALFFALEALERDKKSETESNAGTRATQTQRTAEDEANEDCVAVWMIDAYWLANHLSDEWGGPLLPWSEEASLYLPPLEKLLENDEASKKLIPEDAMPIEPPAMHPRVAAQEGRFVIFGQKRDLLDHLVYRDRQNNCDLEESRVVQIPFVAGQNVDALFDELAHLGVSRRTLFPDLDGLARFVRWKHFRQNPER